MTTSIDDYKPDEILQKRVAMHILSYKREKKYVSEFKMWGVTICYGFLPVFTRHILYSTL